MPQQSKQQDDFLIEILTEELPPKLLYRLADNFLLEIKKELNKLGLHFHSAEWYATPRRLAVLIKKLDANQADAIVERKGPMLKAAFDKEGKPTHACIGFAKSCGVTSAELITLRTVQGEWVGYQQKVAGNAVQIILPKVIQQALTALPIAKRMRWGTSTAQFVRPVKSVIMLYGHEIIETEILGCVTNRFTRGHRFHSKGVLSIAKPTSYLKMLERHYVIADFAKRKTLIRQLANEAMAHKPQLQVMIDENLLDEVTGLVEWPVAVCGSFDEAFLQIPAEVLIAAMTDHQRYFPVINQNKKLMPYFITISNIDSQNKHSVIAGNERVLRARLSDAAFFYAADKKIKLINRVDYLKNIIFQAKLGTLFEKTQRIAYLTKVIAGKMQVDEEKAQRTGLLAKGDLTSQMVGEFPELQGLMGMYYAMHDGEDIEIAQALNEQYLPRFSGDGLPHSSLGLTLALADRIDTLVGIFGINQFPTGDKDPFALRRAALGVLRMLIEKKLNFDLQCLLQSAADQLGNKLENPEVVKDVLDFMFERLRVWYQDQGISADVFAAVLALNLSNPYDFHLRLQAVQHFKKLPAAAALSTANKRVSNILAKSNLQPNSFKQIDETLFEHDAERVLVKTLADKRATVSVFLTEEKYTEALTELAGLRQVVDDFFEHVLVMTDDQLRCKNRLLILGQLRGLFLGVADIALLQ